MSERQRNYEMMGKFEDLPGKRVLSSTVQDLSGAMASMSDVIVKNVDNQLDKAHPVCLQQGEIEEELVKSFRDESSQMNAWIGTRPSTSDNVRRSYAKEQVESIKTEMELIKAFLKDVEAIKEPDSRLKF